MKILLLLSLVFEATSAAYVPGTPGAVWTGEEVDIVRQKVREMINSRNWRGSNPVFWTDGTFSEANGLSLKAAYQGCFDKSDKGKMQVPSGSKLLRLSFHDCVPYLNDNGDPEGGCDGCLNWANMGTAWSSTKLTSPEREFDGRGDNNGLQSTVAALELVYTNISWPSTAPRLNMSLMESGKSRADLWQFAAMVALEQEIERANFACEFDYNVNNQVRLLEGEDKCYFKLFQPSVFKFGRADCVPEDQDPAKRSTNYPYESTRTESHSNIFGGARHILDGLKTDFGLTAREGVSLMAVHSTAAHGHNCRIPEKYKWPGNPYLTNMYFKYIAGIPMYRRYNGLSVKPDIYHSYGDRYGNPGYPTLLKASCKTGWFSNMTKEGAPTGPCFWRPNSSGCNRPGEETTKGCFHHYDEDGNTVLKYGKTDKNNVCPGTTFDEDRIQTSAPNNFNVDSGNQVCGGELTFFLTYEANFAYDFQLDEEMRPYGCNGTMNNLDFQSGTTTRECSRNMDQYENGEALSDITRSFGEDHDLWNKQFMDAWDKMVVNGYSEEQLSPGPQNSWLGFSSQHIGLNEDTQFPVVFTDNSVLNPYTANVKTQTIREACLTVEKWQKWNDYQHLCPPEWRKIHTEWLITNEPGTLKNIEFHIINRKDGRLLQVNTETGSVEAVRANGEDNQKWMYVTSSEGSVTLTNVGANTTYNWIYDTKEKTLMNEDGQFGYSSKKGFVWEDSVRYLKDSPTTPWARNQWDMKLA